MNLKGHFIISVMTASLFYYLTDNTIASIISFISGFFVDIDHIIDYLFIYGRFDIGRMLKGHWFKNRFMVILHSWEIPLIVLVIFGINIYTLGFVIGFCQHLIVDLISYSFENKLLAYWFTYRLIDDFKLNRGFGC